MEEKGRGDTCRIFAWQQRAMLVEAHNQLGHALSWASRLTKWTWRGEWRASPRRASEPFIHMYLGMHGSVALNGRKEEELSPSVDRCAEQQQGSGQHRAVPQRQRHAQPRKEEP